MAHLANTSFGIVSFHGATLPVTIVDNAPFVALKPICEAIGLDWEAQQLRIKRHPVLNSTTFVMKVVAEDGKERDMLVLPLSKLNGWLFGVSVRRVKPELRERLTQYQAECFDVLASHFGVRAPVAALPAPAPQAATATQVGAAMAAGWAAAGLVQQDISRAVMNSGDDWKHQRYLVSFITDSKIGCPPIVDRLPAGAQVMTQEALSKLMTDVAAAAWHNVLGDIKKGVAAWTCA